jgi:hypothetical protein
MFHGHIETIFNTKKIFVCFFPKKKKKKSNQIKKKFVAVLKKMFNEK